MKKLWLYLLLLPLQLSAQAQSMIAEDYYVEAFNEMSDMLAGRDSLSIKREWMKQNCSLIELIWPKSQTKSENVENNKQ